MTHVPERGEPHVWRFFRAGGFDQVRIDNSGDIAALETLDQKLWVALACPTRGVEFDERTLDLIDTDHDGRIRAPEMIDAVNWTVGLLKNADHLLLGRASLPLDAIAVAAPEGQEILASARAMLGVVGKAGATEILLQDMEDIERIYDATAFNGDGIVPAASADDDATARAIADIVECMGGETDRSGKPGLSQAIADRFFREAAFYVAWADEPRSAPARLLPLGDRTGEAAAVVTSLSAKLDDYFTRCRLASYDSRAASGLNAPLATYEALATQEVSDARPEIVALPIARIEPDRPLPLGDGINPAWSDLVDRFRTLVVAPLLDERNSLAETDWHTIKARFADHHEWMTRQPETTAAQLGIERLKALVASDAKARIDDLIARDLAHAPALKAIVKVERLIRLQRDLWPLLNNFIAFRAFYTRTGKALFQAGTLYLDGRSCELCVAVDDETQHSQLATLSRIYLAYCRCTRNRAAETMTIAAAFTAGDADNLRVGRNGVFYDRKGRDWDATIVKIVEHPISLRQSFWLPYKQFARVMGEQVQKMAAARSQATQNQMLARTVAQTAGVASGAQTAAADAAASRQQTFDAARFAGIFAAIGLAIGAIGTAIASTVTGFLQLSWWQMPIAVAGIILVISGPSVLIAALKLRHRNLGPILDASGWAVNTRLRINIPFGNALTALARLPEGAERSLQDPYAEKPRRGPYYLGAVVVALLVVAALWRYGFLMPWLKP